jgi:DNA modification methylase
MVAAEQKATTLRINRGGVLIKAHGEILGDDLRGESLLQMVKESISNGIIFKKEGGACYICFTWRTYSEFEDAMKEAGLNVKACIVWNKKSIGLGYSNYRPQHEFIFYCDGQWYGKNNESDVWELSRGATGEYVHPTQKPVELVARAISNSSKGGDVILELFTGSGSTMVASHQLNRKCYGMELDPKYCDVIVARMIKLDASLPIKRNGQLLPKDELNKFIENTNA